MSKVCYVVEWSWFEVQVHNDWSNNLAYDLRQSSSIIMKSVSALAWTHFCLLAYTFVCVCVLCMCFVVVKFVSVSCLNPYSVPLRNTYTVLWVYATDCGYMLQTVGTCYRLWVHAADCRYILQTGCMLQTVGTCYRLWRYATDCRYMLQTLGYAVDRVGVLQTLLRVCYRFQELLYSVLWGCWCIL